MILEKPHHASNNEACGGVFAFSQFHYNWYQIYPDL